MSGITVGIDGSDHSVRALEWAANEAAVRHAPLTVLTVHLVPQSGWTGNPIIVPPAPRDPTTIRSASREADLMVVGSRGAGGTIIGLPVHPLCGTRWTVRTVSGACRTAASLAAHSSARTE